MTTIELVTMVLVVMATICIGLLYDICRKGQMWKKQEMITSLLCVTFGLFVFVCTTVVGSIIIASTPNLTVELTMALNGAMDTLSFFSHYVGAGLLVVGIVGFVFAFAGYNIYSLLYPIVGCGEKEINDKVE